MSEVRCNTLWIGPALGRVERACLRSLLKQGHPVTLYSYDPVAGVPDGVEVADAAEILPRERIILRAGNPALFTNFFRYRLQALERGLWVDADVYAVRPIRLPDPYLFGWQQPDRINGAVLRLPAESPMLAALLEMFEEREIPFWLAAKARAVAEENLRRTGRICLELAPWGVAGPLALTALAARLNLSHLAQPQEVFYPRGWADAAWVLDPATDLDQVVTGRTLAVHLWNELIKDFKDAPAPEGSFLARLQAEGS